MIITIENTCDLSKEKIEALGVKVVNMQLSCENASVDTTNLDLKEFYRLMRNGEVFRTSQVNEFDAENFFRTYIKDDDILHLGFSSGQSASVETAKRVANKINKEGGHQIYVVDSLCSSSGQGYFCELVVNRLRETNCSIEELRDYAEELKVRIAHYFTVDDLKYLERGGRISKTSAIIGKLLSIKPVLRLDSKGRIVPFQKVISRKKALQRLVELYEELADKSVNLVNISDADCGADAEILKQKLLELNPNLTINIYQIGSTIGSHCGPGTLALYFVRRNDYVNP